MNAITTFGSCLKIWSNCSLNNIRGMAKKQRYPRLHNLPDPSMLVLGSICGNTIVEGDEECDCGFKENCKSPCCDPNTCRLKPNAVCDRGYCCENCQLLAKGTVCRASSGDECDLGEVCTGSSPYCPKYHKADGTSCMNGQAYCADGVCLTRNKLCRLLFGPISTSSDSCYIVNTYGQRGGHCGLHSSKIEYDRCAYEDRFCGKLLCQGGRVGLHGLPTLVWTSSDQQESCHTVTTRSDQSPKEIFMVASGTVCAPGRVCRNRRCENVSGLKCYPKCKSNESCDNTGICRGPVIMLKEEFNGATSIKRHSFDVLWGFMLSILWVKIFQ